MGKMLPVPAINGLTELLGIVNDDSKIKKHLLALKELKDAVVENLSLYARQGEIELYESNANAMHAEAMLIKEDAEALQERAKKSFTKRRKVLREAEAMVAEKEQSISARTVELVKLEKQLAVANTKLAEMKIATRAQFAEEKADLANERALVDEYRKDMVEKIGLAKALFE